MCNSCIKSASAPRLVEEKTLPHASLRSQSFLNRGPVSDSKPIHILFVYRLPCCYLDYRIKIYPCGDWSQHVARLYINSVLRFNNHTLLDVTLIIMGGQNALLSYSKAKNLSLTATRAAYLSHTPFK